MLVQRVIIKPKPPSRVVTWIGASPFRKRQTGLGKNVRDHPDNAGDHAALGILYAYMGRKEEAIRESRRAVELCPESTDALNGPQFACNLALVYALTGEVDQAVTADRTPRPHTWGDQLKPSLTDGGITQAELRLRWQWDKLRGDPRFKKMLERTGAENDLLKSL